MTLRARIAAVASLSVALAVLAAAIGLYVGGALGPARGNRQRSCARRAGARRSTRAGACRRPRGGRSAGQASRRRPPAGEAPRRAISAAVPGQVEPAPFGGASGYVQFVVREGAVRVPGGQGARRRRSRHRASTGRSPRAERQQLQRPDASNGTKLRVLTLPAQGARRGGGGAPARARSNTSSARLLLILALIGGARRRAGGPAGRARGAHGARADRAASRAAPRR